MTTESENLVWRFEAAAASSPDLETRATSHHQPLQTLSSPARLESRDSTCPPFIKHSHLSSDIDIETSPFYQTLSLVC